MGSALAERVGQGEVGGSTALADNAWRPLQLAIERASSALDYNAWRLLQLAGYSHPVGNFCILPHTTVYAPPF